MANWLIPGGGSPDMGNVTADGSELWVSGRYDDEVYVFDTNTGRLTLASRSVVSRMDFACGRSREGIRWAHWKHALRSACRIRQTLAFFLQTLSWFFNEKEAVCQNQE